MAKLTDATVVGKICLNAHCYGNNAAVICPECKEYAVLLTALPGWPGFSNESPAVCGNSTCQCEVFFDTIETERISFGFRRRLLEVVAPAIKCPEDSLGNNGFLQSKGYDEKLVRQALLSMAERDLSRNKIKANLGLKIKQLQGVVISRFGGDFASSKEVLGILIEKEFCKKGTRPNAVGRTLKAELKLPSIKLKKTVFYDLSNFGLNDKERLKCEEVFKSNRKELETIIFLVPQRLINNKCPV